MSYFLSPVCNDQQCDANGNPLVGGKVYTYLSGSSTPAATFTDATSGTQQANPIILNSLGLPASPVWMTNGVSLKFVIQDSTGVTIRTIDNVSGVNDVSLSSTEWVSSGITPTYISASSFSFPGDQTAVFQPKRRLLTVNTGGTVYASIVSATYATGITTIVATTDSGSFDAGISSVSYGLLSVTNPSVPSIYAKSGANSDITSLSGVRTIQPISASVASNALTISASSLSLDFRSTTLGSGVVTNVVGTPANLVVPSTATLGTVSATQSRLVVLALNNAGTIELAVVNIAGGNDLSETGLISTTAISAAATSASVVYSTTARTNVAYRVIGYVESTQATAGTWATAPSTIQGYGGQALAAMSSLGYGQTWQDVAASRVLSTTYYNLSGKPIFISIVATTSAVGTYGTLTVAGSIVNQGNVYGPGGAGSGATFTSQAIIPAGSSYSFAQGGTGSLTINYWKELR